MKPILLFFAFIAALLAPALAQRTTSQDLERQAGEVTIFPRGGDLFQGRVIVVTFPTPMIDAKSIEVPDLEPPFVFTPALEGKFFWKSTTEARFQITQVKPGQRYSVMLREGVKNAVGDAVTDGGGLKQIDYSADPMEISTRFRDKRKALAAKPEVPLSINYPVTAQAVVESVYFQDRDKRTGIAAAVVLGAVEARSEEESVELPSTLTEFFVTPQKALPVKGSYDLIIEGLKDAGTQTPMPGIKAFRLGDTRAVTVEHTEAYAPPLERPSILLQTSASLESDSLDVKAITLSPPVANVSVIADWQGLRIEGDFDTSETYQVTLGPDVRSKTGFPLADRGPFEAAFDGLEPVIVFPQSQFYQRSALGMNVTVLQSNSPETTWRLARIPWPKLAVVRSRLKEFEESKSDPFTGRTRRMIETELLVNALELKTVGTGSFPGVGKNEAVYRNIQWKPENGELRGAYLLEMAAEFGNGRVVGNRSVLFFNELVVNRKFTGSNVIVRTFDMAGANVVPNASVEVVTEENVLLDSGKTDANGFLSMPRGPIEGNRDRDRRPAYIIVRSSQGDAVQPYRGARFSNSAWVGGRADHGVRSLVGPIFSDRNLYRSGESVHFKGTMRWRSTGDDGGVKLDAPVGATVTWRVTQGYRGTELGKGEANVDAFGGWEGIWEIPPKAKLGQYFVHYGLEGFNHHFTHHVQVEAFRTPLFEVEMQAQPDADGPVRVAVQSHYFHGSPNAGALVRWSASWSPNYYLEDDFKESDEHSPDKRDPLNAIAREGEVTLDADGRVELVLANPYPKPHRHSRYRVRVRADVLSPEGQTMSAEVVHIHHPAPQWLAIKCSRVEEESPASKDKELSVAVRVRDRSNEDIVGVPVNLTVYRVETKTVKERVGPQIYRYRNYPQFHGVKRTRIRSGEAFQFEPQHTGHYVAVASLPGNREAAVVSDRIHSVSDGVGRYDVYNDGHIAIQLDKERYQAGKDTARLALEAPFGGQAWVCVETSQIIDHFLIDLKANNQTIALPIKASYYPNVHASVYLLRPGGSEHLPMERYGTVAITVDRPDLHLDVVPEMTASEIQPGEEARGVVKVLCEGQPVLGADVTVFAVDSAVHALGEWQMPKWLGRLYERRWHGVATYRGLDEHFERFEESEVTEKGFLIGGGAELAAAAGLGVQPVFRKDFRALAFWKTRLTTDGNGEVAFAFKAPDNLTEFHLVAVAQTKSHQFGQGDTHFKVAKRLMVEPALARFVRRGDEVEWRAILRQDYVDHVNVTIRVEVEGEIEWLTDMLEQRVALPRGVPQVVRFPCQINGGEAVLVRFQAQAEDVPSMLDAVEREVPVFEPGILQRTGHFGVIPAGADVFALQTHLPELWQRSEGHFQLTASHTPFLPELNSLPEVLEYPHGCFEQRTSRYLLYAFMAGMLDYLPDVKARHANYQEVFQDALRFYEASLLTDGFLPYWEGANQRNEWVTVLAWWFVETLIQQRKEVPVELADALEEAVGMIIEGKTQRHLDYTTRAFAVFAATEAGAPVDAVQPYIADFYARRATLSHDGMAFLVMAMHKAGIMAKEQERLLAFLTNEALPDTGFDPYTFGSLRRTGSLVKLAQIRRSNQRERQALGGAYLQESEKQGAAMLSTQENFWKTLVLKELIAAHEDDSFEAAAVQPEPDYVSENQVSVAWKEAPLQALQDLALRLGKARDKRYYLVRAEVLRQPDSTEVLEDRGFRAERVLRNLTDSNRTGSDEAPFQMGDEVLITYRLQARMNHHYVALTDELPGCFEVVNFNLPQVARLYQLPEGTESDLFLSHDELRDQSVNLYFDYVSAGPHTYSIIARVTAAGTFTWPATAIGPMYQPYFGGLTAGNEVRSRHGS